MKMFQVLGFSKLNPSIVCGLQNEENTIAKICPKFLLKTETYFAQNLKDYIGSYPSFILSNSFSPSVLQLQLSHQ